MDSRFRGNDMWEELRCAHSPNAMSFKRTRYESLLWVFEEVGRVGGGHG